MDVRRRDKKKKRKLGECLSWRMQSDGYLKIRLRWTVQNVFIMEKRIGLVSEEKTEKDTRRIYSAENKFECMFEDVPKKTLGKTQNVFSVQS